MLLQFLFCKFLVVFEPVILTVCDDDEIVQKRIFLATNKDWQFSHLNACLLLLILQCMCTPSEHKGRLTFGAKSMSFVDFGATCGRVDIGKLYSIFSLNNVARSLFAAAFGRITLSIFALVLATAETADNLSFSRSRIR